MKKNVTLIVYTLIMTMWIISCDLNSTAIETSSHFEVSAVTKAGGVTGIELAGDKNDVLSSIFIRGGYTGSMILLYAEPDYKGPPEPFITDDPNFDGWLWNKGNKVGNDKVSSVKIIGDASVTLYSKSHFKVEEGESPLVLNKSCPDFNNIARLWHTANGEYFVNGEKFFGPHRVVDKTWDDCISSIKVHNITSKGVVLYEKDREGEYGNRPGRSQVFFCSCADLSKKYIGDNCVTYIELVNLSESNLILFEGINFCGHSWKYTPPPTPTPTPEATVKPTSTPSPTSAPTKDPLPC